MAFTDLCAACLMADSMGIGSAANVFVYYANGCNAVPALVDDGYDVFGDLLSDDDSSSRSTLHDSNFFFFSFNFLGYTVQGLTTV